MKSSEKILLLAITGILLHVTIVFGRTKDINTVNQTLTEMESPAEDMMDAIQSKDIKRLKYLYMELKQKMTILNQLDEKQPKFGLESKDLTMNLAMENSWFHQITIEMKEMDDFPALSNAVNQFSGELIIMTHFRHPYEKDVAWMDYLGREILLLNSNKKNCVTNNIDLINIRKMELKKIWDKVKKVLLENKNNKSLIIEVDHLINRLMVESNNHKLVSTAQKELELVDNIEQALQID